MRRQPMSEWVCRPESYPPRGLDRVCWASGSPRPTQHRDDTGRWTTGDRGASAVSRHPRIPLGRLRARGSRRLDPVPPERLRAVQRTVGGYQEVRSGRVT